MLEEMTYKEVDGLLYPQIEMPDETEDLTKLGKYGRMAMNYLKENEPARYKTLMRFGKMYEKMSAVEEEANQLYDQLEMQYLAKHKPQNPSSTMEMWKIREQAKMQAEEDVSFLPSVIGSVTTLSESINFHALRTEISLSIPSVCLISIFITCGRTSLIYSGASTPNLFSTK